MTNWDERLRRLICGLLTALVGIIPFVFCWLSDELFEFNKMLVVYAFASVIGGLCLARMVAAKKFIAKRTVFDLPLLAFLLSQVVTTIFSLHPRTSLLGYYTRLNGGLYSTLSYLVLYYAYIHTFTARDRRRLFTVLFTSSILVSLYAIGEHFGHSLSCLIIKGHFNVACWVQDVQNRVYATLGQPNWLAAYNVTVIGLGTMIAFSHWCQRKTHLLNYLAPASIFFNFCSLLFTKSRSGILAFFAGLALTLVLIMISWLHQSKTAILRQIKLLAAILAIFLVPALICGTQYTPSWRELTSRLQAQEPTLEMGLPAHLKGIDVKITDSGDIRKIVWRGALDIWRHHFWLGTGVETFAYSYYLYRPTDHNWTSEWDYLYNKAHNELLNFAANSGLFGLATYLSIFVWLGFYTAVYLLKNHRDTHYLERAHRLIGVSAALFALSITNFFGFSTVSVQVLLFVFLAIAATTYRPVIVTGSVTGFHEPWQKVTLITVSIITFSLLHQVWQTWNADFNYARCKSLISRTGARQALAHCDLAVRLRPHEAMYQIELASYYAQYALALAKQAASESNNDSKNEYLTWSTYYHDAALALSDAGLALNPHNINFYKTRYQMFSSLATIDSSVWERARTDLETALTLSPTDPKLTYYYSLVLDKLGQTEAAAAYLARTLELRPLYYDARLTAAKKAEEAKDFAAASDHYRYIYQFIDERDTIRAQIERLATQSGTLQEEKS